jgi:hypothetical protein
MPMSDVVDLAAEMAAARKRRTEQTARAIRDSRVLAVRSAARPGSTEVEIEELARSFYPRLSPELLAEVTGLVCTLQRGGSTRPPRHDEEDELAPPEL